MLSWAILRVAAYQGSCVSELEAVVACGKEKLSLIQVQSWESEETKNKNVLKPWSHFIPHVFGAYGITSGALNFIFF